MALLVEEWAHELIRKRRAGVSHAFIIAGNVTDYVAREKPADGTSVGAAPYYTVRETLDRILQNNLGPFAFVLHYDVAGGLAFATPEMLERFRVFLVARDRAARAKRAEEKKSVAGSDKEKAGTGPTPAAPKPSGKEIEAKEEAELFDALPVDLRPFYLSLSEEEKERIRHLPDHEARINHLLTIADAQAAQQVNPFAEDAEEPDAPFELPEKPVQVWAFLRAVLCIDFEEFQEHLKASDPAFRQGLVKNPVAVVVHHPELAVDGGDMRGKLSDFEQMVQIILLGLSYDREVGRRGNTIVLVTEDENALPPSLTKPTSGFTTLEIPHPNQDRRTHFLEVLSDRLETLVPTDVRSRQKPLALPKDTTSVELGRGATAGLRLVDLELLGREALVRRPDDESDDEPRLTTAALWERKREYLTRASNGQVKVERPTILPDWIGGHEKAKAYFRAVADMIRRGQRARVPKGVLMVGPPGTGKSTLAQLLAALAGYSFAEIETEFDPFVGMSARNFTRNRRVITQMEPVIVFEDELDRKHLPRGAVFHGDAGTASRQEGLYQEFMADDRRRGKVIWISAANKPDQLEAALTRPGRFDRIIPILPPKTPEGWAAVFAGVARKMTATVEQPFRWAVSQDALLEFAKELPPDAMQGHVNEFCYRALAFTGPEGVLGPEELARGIRDYRPRKEPEYDRQIKLALEFANSEELIPEEYRTPGVPVEDANPESVATLVTKIYEKAPPGTSPPPGTGGSGSDGGGEGGKTN